MSTNPEFNIDDMPAMAIDLDVPVPAENNNKEHTPETLRKLAKSMALIGQFQPIVLRKSNNEIIAGHGRLMAAKLLGWSKIKAVILDVTDEKARKMRIADNLTSNQNYNIDALTFELRDLDLGDDLDAYINDDRMIDNLETALNIKGEMNHDAFVDDLDGAVDDYAHESEDLMDEIDQKPVALKTIFEFTALEPRDARRLNVFMAMIKGEHGADAKDALMAHVEKTIANG